MRTVFVGGACAMAIFVSGAVLPVAPLGTAGASGAAETITAASVGPQVVPLAAPPPASVSLAPHLAQPGAALLASGTVPFPGQSYCLCLVPNGTFALPDTPTPTSTPTDTPAPTATPTLTATVTPTPTQTLVPGGPDVTVTASCTLGAVGLFTITNNGEAMLTTGSWTLTLDTTPIATNTFQLAAGASTSVNTSGLYGALELTVSGGGIPSPVSASATCPTPTPTPTPIPPDIAISSSCTLGAVGLFTITNNGGAMLTAGSWTLTLDTTPIATQAFQLAAGASTSVSTSGLFGVLELTASGGGIPSPVTSSATCPTPTPTPTPVPPDIAISASCTLGAVGLFTITNNGGAMLTAGSWTLTLDATPIATQAFQLAAGASTSVNTSGLFGVLELMASGGGIPSPVTSSATCPTPTPTPTNTPVAAPAAAPLAATAAPVPPRRQVWQSPSSKRAGTLATGISCVASAEITPTGTTFSNVALVAPAAGSYDLLLLDGPCGSSTATVLAMDAPGDAAGLVVSPAIPAGGRGGLLLFVVALAVAGWFLIRASKG